MENKETIIEIRGISIKEGKTGQQYFSIETDQGIVTCFEKPIVDELKKNVGNHVKVEIAENAKGFRNLRKFLGIATKTEVQAKPQAEPRADLFAEARDSKNKAMFVSYAKDIFLEILKSKMPEEPETAVMIRAIKLVKMAIQSFDSTDEIVA